jgi:pyoverdine/dityrosine biosynthesis protein Dit1
MLFFMKKLILTALGLGTVSVGGSDVPLYKVFDCYRLRQDIDAACVGLSSPGSCFVKGVAEFKEKLKKAISSGRKLQLFLVGFPFKSRNHQDKVLSGKVDMAEYDALRFLNEFLVQICKNYKPGVHLTILLDGCAFADLLGVSLTEVQHYEKDLKKLAASFPNISIVGSQDFAAKGMNHFLSYLQGFSCDAGVREKQQKEQDPSTKESLKRRLCLEFADPLGQEYLRARKINIEQLEKQLSLRSACFGAFVKKHYYSLHPEAFRLSVHFSKDLSKSFSIQLSKGSNLTPWHGVPRLEKDGSYKIVYKRDIDLSKYSLFYYNVNGVRCAYYALKK